MFEQLGDGVVRRRGSHIRLRHATDPSRKPLTVPDHRTLKPGLLRHLMRDAQVDPEEFRRLLNQERQRSYERVCDGRSHYARNYARDRPAQARNHPPPAKRPKKNPSASPRLTEGFTFARLLDRPVW